MSFGTFLLRLVGRSPEQVEQQERFERSVAAIDTTGEELDELLQKIKEVDEVCQQTKASYDRTTSSVRPPSIDSEELDVPPVLIKHSV